MVPFDDNSVDYATFTELPAASTDDFMNDGAELLEWSVVAQSLFALLPDDSTVFPSPSYSSETSYGSNFAELGLDFDFNSRPSEGNTSVIDEHVNILIQTSPEESNAATIGSNITAISRYFISTL